MTPKEKLIRARAKLVLNNPFFGTLALRLRIEETDRFSLAATDGITLYYNPQGIDKLPLNKLIGLVAHEVMHPAMLHHLRRGERSQKKWNMACDYAINSILLDSGFVLPSGGCVDAKYRNMTAEHIYTLLPDEQDSENEQDPGGDGAVIDSPNKDAAYEEANWKQAVAQAMHVAKQCGDLPSGMERLIEELLEPVLPWKAILRRFMTEKANDDFSWLRGNRRFIAQGLYLPSRRSEDTISTIVIVIDTSGSVSNKELTEFGSEINGIHKEVKPHKLIVIYCDAAINKVEEFGPEDEIVFSMCGGGGTDFRPPFVWLSEQNIIPRVFVYLTDGYGRYPEEAPMFPNLWVINNYDSTPPYGEHIVMEV